MVKSLLSNILIAKRQNKKIIKVSHYKSYNKFLSLLWNEGFIYGYKIKTYKKSYFFYKIFLKYNEKNFYPLKKLKFLSGIFKRKSLINLNKLDKNFFSILINDKGFFSQRSCIKLGMGGKMFVKV